MSFFSNLIELFYKYTRPSIPVIESTTLSMEFEDGGKRQFVYRKTLDTVEICDNLNAIFEEHEGQEIKGDIEVFKYQRTGNQENESLNFLQIQE